MSTFGERAVGLDFNPGGNPAVTKVKERFAATIDLLISLQPEDNLDVQRLTEIAITSIQTAQMWTVKAITAPQS